MGIRTGIAGLAAAAVVAVGLAFAAPAPDAGVSGRELSHREATAKLRKANIRWTSSGGCSDRNSPRCTSFSGVKSGTISGIITFKRSSGCAVTITGGTETGHASGTFSHWNGYKVDITPSTCVNRYIKRNFTSIGGNRWRSSAGNVYYNEGNHWDITYY
jgi:hypothetical protein